MTQASEQQAAMMTYVALMDEARWRLNFMKSTYEKRGEIPTFMVREHCYLQLRLICEIIALGCLVVHGDIPKVGALKKAYKPKAIFNQIEKLKPDYYPNGVSRSYIDGAKGFIPWPPDEQLTKDDLEALWNESGRHLHRGHFKNLGTGEEILISLEQSGEPLSEIAEWINKVVHLLDCHVISLIEPKKMMILTLFVPETKGARADVLDITDDETELIAHVTRYGFRLADSQQC